MKKYELFEQIQNGKKEKNYIQRYIICLFFYNISGQHGTFKRKKKKLSSSNFNNWTREKKI